MFKQGYYLIKACRPQTLVVASFPVLIACSLTIQQGLFYFPDDLIISINILLAAILIQIISNLVNDYCGYLSGTDKLLKNRSKVLLSGVVSPKLFRIFILNILLLTLIVALPLVVMGGWKILLIGVSGLLFAYLYSATKYSLANNYLSELFVFLFFGPIATLGSYFLLTKQISVSSIMIGVTPGLLGVALLTLNNLRDYQADLEAGRKNLVTYLGIKKNITLLRVLLIISPAFLILISHNWKFIATISIGVIITNYLSWIVLKGEVNYPKAFLTTVTLIIVLQLAIIISS